METKRRALGKGLEELFNTEQIDINKVEEKIIENTPKNEIVELNLDDLRSNPYQPRRTFDEEALQELSSSIKEYGVFQPIIAKKSIKGYEIVAGERRVLASRMAGLDKIPAIVKEFSDEEMMEIALLENLQRENLNAMEEAMAYKKIQQSLNITQEELAKKVGKSRSHVTNMMGLLNLPEEVKDMILTKEISMGHARILSKLDDKEQIKKLANDVIEKKLSVRQLEDVTNSPIDFQRKKEIKRKERDGSEYSYIENALCDKLGTKVRIKKNKVEIKFENAADLTRLLEIMQLDK
jgi:ParB family chromosome partitioning protein